MNEAKRLSAQDHDPTCTYCGTQNMTMTIGRYQIHAVDGERRRWEAAKSAVAPTRRTTPR